MEYMDSGFQQDTGRGLHWNMFFSYGLLRASLLTQMVKNPPTTWETWIWSLGWEDPLVMIWQPTPVFLHGESPWTEEPVGLQSMGLQRVRHDWALTHQAPQFHGRVFMCLSKHRRSNILLPENLISVAWVDFQRWGNSSENISHSVTLRSEPPEYLACFTLICPF